MPNDVRQRMLRGIFQGFKRSSKFHTQSIFKARSLFYGYVIYSCKISNRRFRVGHNLRLVRSSLWLEHPLFKCFFLRIWTVLYFLYRVRLLNMKIFLANVSGIRRPYMLLLFPKTKLHFFCRSFPISM